MVDMAKSNLLGFNYRYPIVDEDITFTLDKFSILIRKAYVCTRV